MQSTIERLELLNECLLRCLSEAGSVAFKLRSLRPIICDWSASTLVRLVFFNVVVEGRLGRVQARSSRSRASAFD